MVLVFDVSADLAMFRKPYTTTSLVSFPFPPPTAVAGLIGAVVGMDHGAAQGSWRADFWRHFSGSSISLRLKRAPSWLTTAVNLIKFKYPSGDMREHIQAKHQLLKKPAYRIYFKGGELYPELKKRLTRKEFVFTPYLGAAWALAEIDFCGEFPAEEITEEESWVDTVVPVLEGVKVDVLRSGAIHRELVPFRLDEERRLKETVNVVYQELQKEKKLWLKHKGNLSLSRVGDERVAWFANW
jgi:CRISPR-associated protein Cas5h